MNSVTFLGTSGMVPTKQRNVQSIFVNFRGQGLLFDCGEGTQRQLLHAGISHQKISTIFISHWHGDHVIGLLGLLQTIDNFASEDKTLRIIGPPGSQEYFSHMMQSCAFDLSLPVAVQEVEFPGVVFEHKDFVVQAEFLDHGIPCLGFRLEERTTYALQSPDSLSHLPGPLRGELTLGKDVEFEGTVYRHEEHTRKKQPFILSFIFDTKICPACFLLAKDATLLISEAVYTNDLVEKANEHYHMTAYQVGQLARDSNVQELVLTHFSQRYKDVEELEQDAKRAFSAVRLAHDFLKITF